MPPKRYRTQLRPAPATPRKPRRRRKQVNASTLSLKQVAALHEAAQPLMEWMKQNGHPHISAIITSERCEVVEALAAVLRALVEGGRLLFCRFDKKSS